MDYIAFITGLFLLISGGAAAFLSLRDRCVSRWPIFSALTLCLAGSLWFPLISFAISGPKTLEMIPILLGACSAATSLAFALSPLSKSSRLHFIGKWSLVLLTFISCSYFGSANPCSPLYLGPILLGAFAAGWKSCSFCNELYHRHQPSHPAVPALLLTTTAAVCFLPASAAFTYDTYGLGLTGERLWRAAALITAALTSIGFCWLLWFRSFKPAKHQFSASLRRRRLNTTATLLLALVITLANGAWFASWIGNTSKREQTSAILSALQLIASSLDPELIQSIQPNPEAVHTQAYQTLRARLLEIRRAFPDVRFSYLLGLRNEKLVFLVDAEDPSNTDDFSPPGLPVHDYPRRWLPELAGQATFNGPDRDAWGVWFAAAVPVFAHSDQHATTPTVQPEVVAILGADFPSTLWLHPIAARRQAAMAITLSVAILLSVLFAFQLLSSERSSHIEQLTSRLHDAMQAADFDVWECLLNPFKIIVGDHLIASLGWSKLPARYPFRRIWSRIHPEDRDQLLNLTKQDATTDAEVRIKNDAGQWVWFSLRGHVVAADGDTPLRIVGIVVNIDERKRMQLDLNRQQQFANSVMAAVPQGLVVTNDVGTITFANPAMCLLTRKRIEELVGSAIQEWLPLPTPLSESPEPFETVISPEGVQPIPVKIFPTGLVAAGGTHQWMFSVVDLTSVREAESQLRASRAEVERLALVAKRTDNAVIITDPTGRIEWVNEGFTRMSGYSREEAIGRPPGSFLQANPHESATRAYMREKVRAGQSFDIEIVNVHKDGSPYTAHIECQPLHQGDGSLTGFMAIVRDVSKVRRTTKLLEAAASIGASLISWPISHELWNLVVSTIGTAADANRCTLFQVRHHAVTNAPCATQIAEWCCPATHSHIHLPIHQELHFHDLGLRTIYQSLSSGRLLSGPVKQLPDSERRFFESIGIVSLTAVPIFRGEEFWGFLGVDDCCSERTWDTWEVSILKSIAANIGLRLVAQQESDALVLARNQAFEAAEAAEKANRAKSTFLATMSHEIRTPLNAVIGMASLLETTPLNHQQKDYAATILSSSNFLLELINDILDYSRIESGHLEIESSCFSLHSVCQQAFDVIRPGAAGKQLELICRVASHLPSHFLGDSARIRQILVNLLSNAVKFTHSGFVSLLIDGCEQPNQRWHITLEVKDSGIGISSEAQQRLFKPFVQADSSTTRRFGGSGLGLAISKRLASIMGGDITVHSVQGQGATFTVSVTLPVAQQTSPTHSSKAELTVSDAPLNLLIVDDNELNRRILEETLASWGLPCHSAANAPGAIRLWKHHGPYDLVIADHHMPDMDGVELTQYLRTLPNATATRFALLSSETNYPPDIRSLFDEIGPKPIWPATIHAMLARVFPGRISDDSKAHQSPEHLDATSLAKLHVLVAEDNLNNQKVIRLLLRRLGIEPHMAADGSAALQAAQDQAFDVILLDIQMPLMDGLEACRAIRALTLPKRPFIVALTANVFQEDRDAAMQAGMDDYLSKPITLARLRETLSHVLKFLPVP